MLPTWDTVVLSLFTINRLRKLTGAHFQAQPSAFFLPRVSLKVQRPLPAPSSGGRHLSPCGPFQLPSAFNDLWLNPSLREARPSWRSVATPAFPITARGPAQSRNIPHHTHTKGKGLVYELN